MKHKGFKETLQILDKNLTFGEYYSIGQGCELEYVRIGDKVIIRRPAKFTAKGNK